ncbi:MAG: hypothetical protein RQ839_10605 [Thermoproteus sp.]|jgi:hypothetical protein|nr:hypothetical protein [Thermoproteus sp.]MDT7882976.1 hypothetical protein [Thermoproteus sp.]
MTAGTPAVRPAGRRPLAEDLSAYLNFIDCEAIERAVRLTPPALIDKLCKGEFLPPVSSDAIFIEELLEIARRLNRSHLVTIVKGDP